MASTPFVPAPIEGLKYPNVARMFGARVARTPARPALRHKEAGTWRTLTWAQWDRAAQEIAAGLVVGLGVKRGDRVAILSHTRLEWALVDVALALCGAISVPIYPSLTADHVTYILADSKCRVAVVEDPHLLLRVLAPEHRERIACVEHLVYLDDTVDVASRDAPGRLDLRDVPPEGPPRRSLGALRELGAARLAEADEALRAGREGVGLDDAFTHVYTSGTTGIPKGVVLTHRNLIFESWAIKNVVPVDETDEQLLLLPLAHIFSRHMLWGAVEQGAVSSFAESLDTVAANFLEIAPTFVAAVPRLYEKVYHQIMRDMVGGGALKQGTLQWCMDVGRRVSVARQRGQAPPTALALKMAVADRLLFNRVKAIFGGRLRFFVSGGAPLSKELAEFFHAAGILILEGYGLTETTGATNVNRPDRYRFGTVGPAMPGCEIRIAPDSEVLVRGHNVMARYHNLPQETAEVLDEDGWFHTGDIGELTDGFLRITDRKKDLMKTAAGKYVAPQPIENRLELKEGISHAIVHADGRPYAVALVTLDGPAIAALAEREGLGAKTEAELARHPRIRQIVQGHVDEVNRGLASFETIKRFAILPGDLSEEAGELTPTLKVKRKVVLSRHGHLLDALYDEPGADGRESRQSS